MYSYTFFFLIYREKSKQLAEQGAAIVALSVLGEHDGRKPNIDSPNDEVLRVWREHFQMTDMNIYKHKTEDCRKSESDSINRTGIGTNASGCFNRTVIDKHACSIQETVVKLSDNNFVTNECGDSLTKETADFIETAGNDQCSGR